MSERIVLLGWAGEALELDALDADALVTHKQCRVSMTKWGGRLATATVLHPHKRLLGVPMENATEDDYRRAMETIRKLCPHARSFDIDWPIQVGAAYEVDKYELKWAGTDRTAVVVHARPDQGFAWIPSLGQAPEGELELFRDGALIARGEWGRMEAVAE